MRDLNEFLNETKRRRAWSGKLNQVDNLMSWLYDKDILGKGEKNKKDSLFRQYYRYYNDGDFPRALSRLGLSKYNNPERIENALEELLDDFIKQILTKYLPKINRTEFRYDQALSDLNTLKGVIDRNDFHGIVTYWGKKTKVDSPEFNKLLADLGKEYSVYKKAIKDYIDNLDLSKYGEYSFDQPSDSKTAAFNRQAMKEKGDWPKDLEKGFQRLEDITREMGYKVNDVIVFTQRAKELLEHTESRYEFDMIYESHAKDLKSIMQSAKKATAPFTVVVIDEKRGKVIHQEIGIISRELIPAYYRTTVERFPDMEIRVEDSTGQGVI